MKTVSACTDCRVAKRKCHKPDLPGKCRECIKRRLHCSLDIPERLASVPRPLRQAESPELETIETAEELLSFHVREKLVDHYLHYIHDRPHSLFHRPSLQNSVKDGTIRSDLLLAICAIGSRFSLDSSVRKLESKMVSLSRCLFYESLENVCLESIQTCILLANIYASELQTSSEALFFGIAVRMAHIMDLPTVSATDSATTCEIKRRVWWTIYMADRWCSSGLGIPRQIDHESSLRISLPIDEAVFHAPDFDSTGNAHDHDPGLWASMIILAKIFGEIQDLNRQIVTEDICEQSMEDTVTSLAMQLEDWERNLPHHVRLSEKSLNEHKIRGMGGTFVALHLGYHHYCMLLFFNFLDVQRSTSPRAPEFASRCQYHAISYSWLLEMSRKKGDCEAVYATVGHMTVVSSSVLIHRLLFGDDDQIDEARKYLVANFEALTELKQYWPSLKNSVSGLQVVCSDLADPNLDAQLHRLLTFQNACLWSVDMNTHKVDRWMIRFLFEYALPLDDKHLLPVDNPEWDDNYSRFEAAEHETLVRRHRLTNEMLSTYL